jgi:hypothetical protein
VVDLAHLEEPRDHERADGGRVREVSLRARREVID